jgi:hypothetical protein
MMNNQVDYLVNGHTHPDRALYLHHEGFLEVNAIDVIDHSHFGIMSFDREQMIYHEIGIDDNIVALVTYPVPKVQVNKRTRFNVGKDEIRVVVFNESKDVNIIVQGSVNGSMKFSRIIRRNLSLYTLPFDLGPGSYHVDFSGEWKSSLDFVIGDSVKLDIESVPTPWNDDERRAVTFYIYLISLIIATIPVGKLSIGDRVNSWVNGNDDNEHIWAVVSFFITPITLRSRLARLSRSVQWSLFLLTLAPLFVPVIVTILNDQFYIIFWAGYLANWRYSFDYDSQWYALIFLGWTTLAYVNAISHSSLEWTKAMAIDWGYMIWGIFPTHNVLENKKELNGLGARLTSPLLVILPQIVFLVFFFYKWRERKQRQRDATHSADIDEVTRIL